MADRPQNKAGRSVPRRNALNMDGALGQLGMKLQNVRLQKNWNVLKAATEADLKSDTIKSLEQGKGTLRNFIKYCSGLGCMLFVSPDENGEMNVDVEMVDFSNSDSE